MQSRSQQTLSIETRLKAGESLSSIARNVGVSRSRVQHISRRLLRDYESVTDAANGSGEQVSNSHMKSLTINLTPAVYDALVEACEVTNRKFPEEPITILEYVEECVINRVVDLGLLRRKKQK
jgi:hypothetical protein